MQPPTLLIGSEPRILLPVARCLARHHIPVLLAQSEGVSNAARASRVWEEVITLPADGELAVDAVEEFARRHGASWMVPIPDGWLGKLATHRERLSRVGRVAVPSLRSSRIVLEKERTLEFARSLGIPLPRAFDIASDETFEAVATELTFPLVGKPATKGSERYDFKWRRYDRLDALAAEFARERRFGEGLIFQEYVPGYGVGVQLLLHEGEVVTAFQHRRLRELPAAGGVAVAAEAEALDPSLLAHALKLLRAIEWEGVAMVEFRRDPATGRSVLMEVNGRYWGSISLPIHVGLEFPYYHWQVTHGLVPHVPRTYRVGTRMSWLVGEFQRVVELVTTPVKNDPKLGVVSAIGNFAQGLDPRNRRAVWSKTDPAPAVLEVADAVSVVVRRLVRSVFVGLLPASFRADLRRASSLSGKVRAAYLFQRMTRRIGLRGSSQLPKLAMRRVVFVCHGNIMRSAAAEALLRARLTSLGVDDVEISSAGVHAHTGRPADPRVCSVLAEWGLSLDSHSSRPIDDRTASAADALVAMDDLNVALLVSRYPQVRGRTFLLSSVRSGRDRGAEIADPYHGDLSEVRRAIETIRADVDQLAALIVTQRRSSR